MIERFVSLPNPDVELATVMVIGGALTNKLCQVVYDGQLGTDHYMAAQERFFPNPPANIKDYDETFKRAEEAAETVFARGSDKRLVLVGHSFGGLVAVKLGLKRPDIVAHVKSLAGLQEGYTDTIGVKAVKELVGDGIKNAEHGRADSAHIQALKEEIASEWSPGVGLSLHSAMFDVCFPLPQGLGLQLPEGRQPSRRVIGPRLSFLMNILAHKDLPLGTQLLPDLYPTEHVLLPLSPADIRDTLKLRAQVAASEQARPAEPVSMLQPRFEPALAA